MTNVSYQEYDLYIDESGSFTEAAHPSGGSGNREPTSDSRPSQLAGVLVRRGALSPARARTALNACYRAAGIQVTGAIHGSTFCAGATYDELISELVRQCELYEWQPVRITNLERVHFGNRSTTYTNLVAELVLRIFQEKHLQGASDLRINVFYAVVKLGEDKSGAPYFLEREEYWKRLQEYLAFAMVRRGLAEHASQWQLGMLRQYSARRDPELQICDLLSNASYAHFRKCGGKTTDQLRTAFGRFDMTLRLSELLERVDQHLADDSLGVAIIVLAEGLTKNTLSRQAHGEAEKRLGQAVSRLSQCGAPARDPQLSILLNWLEQIVELQRSLDLGISVATWLLDNVADALAKNLSDRGDDASICWFVYGLRFWLLTAWNHQGDLENARAASNDMDALTASLAGRWEHALMLIRGLVAQSVHCIDCFEHNDASRRMESVSRFFGNLADLFGDAFPGMFPERVRSDMCGQALGTWMQSELYAGLTAPERLQLARELNEKAISEFSTTADRRRQHQYRCQIETASDNVPLAKEYLAVSLEITESTDSAIAAAVVNALDADRIAGAFALLHWLRCGATACLSATEHDRVAFLKALERSSVLQNDWCEGRMTTYPVHGILRQLAKIRASQGERDEAIRHLRSLQDVTGPLRKSPLAPVLIVAATTAEIAGLLWGNERRHARRLLSSRKADRPSLVEVLALIKERSTDSFPSIWAVTEEWKMCIDRALQDDINPEEFGPLMCQLARRIGY